ncbi:hypothetical protein MN608_08873 [Microdochium nivale]|nr:hypothetical protein MN608_08873 [Microdochium nivale]
MVLIEKVSYLYKGQGQVALGQAHMDFVLSLRARSLHEQHKQANLITLNCLGAYKVHRDDGGIHRRSTTVEYGLVQKYPDGCEAGPGTSSPTTFQLLLDSIPHPSWLYKNFNSDHVLLFTMGKAVLCDPPARAQASANPPWLVLRVGGLRTSRPDGGFWETSGPDKNSLPAPNA